MFRLSVFRPLLVCAAGAILASAAFPQSKVAIINVQKAILDTAEIKKAQVDLEAKYKQRTDALQKAQRDLQDLQTQLQNSGDKLSPEGRVDLEANAARKQREAQRMTEDLQSDIDRDRNDILQRAGTRMREVVQKLAEAKAVDVVIDVSNTFYFKPALEITAEATAAYDKTFPVK